jgi:nicotinamide-nucleotide amidase
MDSVGRESQVSDAALALGRRLEALGRSIATVESCTGGMVACALTEFAGSSAWFERGFVTYSNASKIDLVGVARATLEAHGAVSEETAREMAAGALARSRAALALAITGIAGPTGAAAGKPVGTVCFAWATAQAVTSETRRFDGDRHAVRAAAAVHALREALRHLG